MPSYLITYKDPKGRYIQRTIISKTPQRAYDAAARNYDAIHGKGEFDKLTVGVKLKYPQSNPKLPLNKWIKASKVRISRGKVEIQT